jgi:hypothetical protein
MTRPPSTCNHRTVEARASTLVSPCGICGEQSGTGAGFSPSSSVFSCQYHSTIALDVHISPGRWTTGPLVATVQRQQIHLLVTISLLFNSAYIKWYCVLTLPLACHGSCWCINAESICCAFMPIITAFARHQTIV